MKHTIQQVFHSGKFMVGFCIFAAVLLIVLVYPLFVPHPPLAIIGQGTFFPPGIYVNVYDSIGTTHYTLNLDDATAKRIASKLSNDDRAAMKAWLILAGIRESQIDLADTAKLLDLWEKSFDPNKSLPGLTNAKRNYYDRLNDSLQGLLSTEGLIVTAAGAGTSAGTSAGPTVVAAPGSAAVAGGVMGGGLAPAASGGAGTGTAARAGGAPDSTVNQSDFANIGQVANVRVLPLGTDNFGRDVLTELVKATGVSLEIGLVAGLIATLIGLTLGLLAGYIGGLADDLIMFVTNLFTVIPPLVLLILISFSIGQDKRGAFTIAMVIGFTSWVWTARSVRSQVMSLRNRDHVNLSKISGHSIVHIILTDILPYIASYVVMALILQISLGILAEATLSFIGLGPRTTEVPTLGLMMNWAMIYQAEILGKWWAYLPVLITIALITFSMNLMNTGLDQVFNPALRE
ncbi:MAG TPA: ABC transporter permease [Anaerolineae bacterium]